GCLFQWCTGVEGTRAGFEPARPGSALRRLVMTAEEALASLVNEGRTVNNETVRHRIELIRDSIAWAGNELAVWSGMKAEVYTIPDTVNKLALTKELKDELTQSKPDFKRVIDKALSGGANELFGLWQKVIDGKIESKDGKPYAANTVKAKKQTLEILKRYQEYAGVTLTFDSMDMKFY